MTRPRLRHDGKPRIFLAYAHEDIAKVWDIYKQLVADGYVPWFDKERLPPGEPWKPAIQKAIRNSDVFIAFFSPNAINKDGFIQEELKLAIDTARRRPPGKIRLIPSLLNKCNLPKYWLQLHCLDLCDKAWKEHGYQKLLEVLGPVPAPKIPAKGWEPLERLVRDAALTAGMAAMRYYRAALYKSGPFSGSANPSTMADEYATVSLLQTLHNADRLASELNCPYVVFAEELDDPAVASRILKNFEGSPVFSKIKRSTDEFREDWSNKLAILVDAIDGTANFDAGLPFFGSAVAAFIRGQLCAGAVYDPFHHQVFYGSIRRGENDEQKVANLWSINSGHVELLRRRDAPSASRCLIATHLTRSDEKERSRFLKFLPHLYDDHSLKCGIYMLNSGQMALAHIAWGNVDAFINNKTKIWDVAAGEVLIRAVGGKVTDFEGREINYTARPDTSVLACRTPELHKRLLRVIRSRYA